jgi:hypothetical protein
MMYMMQERLPDRKHVASTATLLQGLEYFGWKQNDEMSLKLGGMNYSVRWLLLIVLGLI